MDTRECCLWSELRHRGQEDPIILRELLDRYYDPICRHLIQQLADRHVYDRDAILDLCDATFRAFMRRAETGTAMEPNSLLELLHQIADEKVAAFFDIVPFTLHQGETTRLDQLLSEKRTSYAFNLSSSSREGSSQPKRRLAHRFLKALMRPKMLQLALTLLLVGLLYQAKPIKRYAALWFDPTLSDRTAEIENWHVVLAPSNAEREEGRKPWLDDGHLPSPPSAQRQGKSPSRRVQEPSASERKPASGANSPSHKNVGSGGKLHTRTPGLIDPPSTDRTGDAFLANLPTGDGGDEPGTSVLRADLPASAPRHPRDPRRIHETVVAHNPAIQDCYKLALRRRPDLQGKLVVRFTISWDGRVSAAEVLASTLDDSQLERCVLKRIRRWNDFPPADPDYGETRFVQEYKFGIE